MTEATQDQQTGEDNDQANGPPEVLLAQGLARALGSTAGGVTVVETDTGVELSFPDTDGSTAA